MNQVLIFNIHLLLGYIAWLLCFGAYIWPKLRTMAAQDAHRAIATLHSFRFFGLVFIVPGVVGTLPPAFAVPAAWGDLATGVLALLALAAVAVMAAAVALTTVGRPYLGTLAAWWDTVMFRLQELL